MHATRRAASTTLAFAAAAILLAASFAEAAKPTAPSDLEIPFETVPASKVTSRSRVDLASGRPLELFHVDYRVQPGTPEDMARQFLHAASDALRLDDPEGSDLVLHATRTGPSGTVVRFRQTVDGIPVYGPDLAIKLDNDDRVTYVANGYRPGLRLDDPDPTLSAAQARAAGLAHVEPVGGLGWEDVLLVAFPVGRAARLAYQVDFEPRISPLGSWRVMVDAHTGEVFGAVNRAVNVDAPATVFDPDPLSSSGASYGDTGFVDGNDADTAQLTAETMSRTLLDVTQSSPGVFELTGPWAECVDFEGPFDGCYEQSSAAWNFTRNAQAFEQANAYYHIDTYMRYLNLTLGLAIQPFAYAGGVQYDGLGFNGADNSHYLSGSQRVAFGEGGVDDAEDADVLIHELGHGLHDWATGGGLSQVQGLSEGIGDYCAAEYSRSFGQWGSGVPQHQWVFSWDGHNPFWGGRVTDWNDTHTYPGDLVGQVHTDGQFWASCNMDVWDAIGRDQSVTAHWEGLKMTNGGTNQQAAAQAVVQAASDLAFAQGDIDAIVAVFQGCGYAVTAPPLFADGFESGDVLAWSAAVP